MTGTTTSPTPELTAWLAERVAFYLDLPAGSIDPDVELAAYGLDSLYLHSLVSDVEDQLGLMLAAEQVYDHPTITALATHLDRLRANDRRPGPDATAR
jgi:acyl carrier protein